MSSAKAALKSAREAILRKDCNTARDLCNSIIPQLEDGDQKYNAYCFLGRAEELSDNLDQSELAYRKAISISDSNLVAWQGLEKVYEKKDDHAQWNEVLMKLQPMYIAANDGKKLTELLRRRVELTSEHLSSSEAIEALENLLPKRAWFSLIEDQSIPHLKETLTRLASLYEDQMSDYITREIQTRRMRLGAPPIDVIRYEVESSAVQSPLGQIYDDLAQYDLDLDTQLRMFEFNVRKVPHVDPNDKPAMWEKIKTMANNLASGHVRSPVPYKIILDTMDVDARGYSCSFFDFVSKEMNDSELGKLITAYQKWSKTGPDPAIMSSVKGAISGISPSTFASHFAAALYFDNGDYEVSIEYGKLTETQAKDVKSKFGLELNRVGLSIDHISAKAHLWIGGDTNLQVALSKFQKILSVVRTDLDAFKGLGYVLTEMKRYEEAIRCFEKVQKVFSEEATSQLGWIKFLQKDYKTASDLLLPLVEEGSSDRSQSLHHYRMGKVLWELGEKRQAFKLMLSSAKLDPTFGPAFVSLGYWYWDLDKDRNRAIKCFLHSLEISKNFDDESTALALCRLLSEDGRFAEALAVLNSVVQSSPRAGQSWRFLGFLNLRLNNWDEAAVCFQNSLRINTDDHIVWDGLAEAYTKSGKYLAALKISTRIFTFEDVENNKTVLFHAHYRIGTINSRIGLYPKAIESFEAALGCVEGHERAPAKFNVPALYNLVLTRMHYVRELCQSGAYGRASAELNFAVEESCDLALNYRRTLDQAEAKSPSMTCSVYVLLGDVLDLHALLPQLPSPISFATFKAIYRLLTSLVLEKVFNDSRSLERLATLLREPEASISVSDVLALSGLSYRAGIICHRRLALTKDDLDGATIAECYFKLSITYYHQIKFSQALAEQVKGELALNAIRCIKIALSFCPTNANFWNALGIYCSADNSQLAQYAFARAIEMGGEISSYTVNLGYMSLIEKDHVFASKAFENGRSIDPENASSWMGIGIAEEMRTRDNKALKASVSIEDVIDHAHEINNGVELQVDLKYAAQSLRRVLQKPKPSVEEIAKLTDSVFSLVKFVERHPDDVYARNVLGLLLELQQQHEAALLQFSAAIVSLRLRSNTEPNKSELSILLENQGRVLCASGRYEESLLSFEEATKLRTSSSSAVFLHLCWGISLFFCGQLQEAMVKLEVAQAGADHLKTLAVPRSFADEAVAKRTTAQAALLVSQVLYALGTETHIDLARSELLRCVQVDPSYIKPFLALCAMGIAQNDQNLASAAAAELSQALTTGRVDFSDEIFEALACLHNVQQPAVKKIALRVLSRALKHRPWIATRWIKLAERLSRDDNCDPRIPQRVSQSGLTILNNSNTEHVSADTFARSHLVDGISAIVSGTRATDTKRRPSRTRYLARCVRAQPSNLELWGALVWANRADLAVDSAKAIADKELKVVSSETDETESAASSGKTITAKSVVSTCHRLEEICKFVSTQCLCRIENQSSNMFVPGVGSESAVRLRSLYHWTQLYQAETTFVRVGVHIARGELETVPGAAADLNVAYQLAEAVVSGVLAEVNSTELVPSDGYRSNLQRLLAAGYCVLARCLVRNYQLGHMDDSTITNAVQCYQQAISLQPEWSFIPEELSQLYRLFASGGVQAYLAESEKILRERINALPESSPARIAMWLRIAQLGLVTNNPATVREAVGVVEETLKVEGWDSENVNLSTRVASEALAAARLLQGHSLLVVGGKGAVTKAAKLFKTLIDEPESNSKESTEDTVEAPAMPNAFPWACWSMSLVAKSSDVTDKLRQEMNIKSPDDYLRWERGIQPLNLFLDNIAD
ncbi:hypothetical protein BJ742DRAFT_786021 [Cladochytrium replicatum]|nr:hypothetical protein BJ742DRAFT_786021 [Cladochytrium replicatum]